MDHQIPRLGLKGLGPLDRVVELRHKITRGRDQFPRDHGLIDLRPTLATVHVSFLAERGRQGNDQASNDRHTSFTAQSRTGTAM